MMSSVIPARLEFQCGHAALVSLPRIKGETSAQRADRVAREKSDARTRACDFCAQRLEVVVQQAAPVPVPAPVPAAVPTPVAPQLPTPLPVPRISVPDRPTVVTPKPATPKPLPATVLAEPGPLATRRQYQRRNGTHKVKRVEPVHSASAAHFTVQFQVETLLRAADMREALRQAQSLGAIEVLAITRES